MSGSLASKAPCGTDSSYRLAASVLCAIAAVAVQAVEPWDHADVILRGPAGGNPYVDVQLRARFTQGDRVIDVPGFWDGDDVYRVRFSPPTVGTWHYVTSSNRDRKSVV